jgi:hypothetical protein
VSTSDSIVYILHLFYFIPSADVADERSTASTWAVTVASAEVVRTCSYRCIHQPLGCAVLQRLLVGA